MPRKLRVSPGSAAPERPRCSETLQRQEARLIG